MMTAISKYSTSVYINKRLEEKPHISIHFPLLIKLEFERESWKERKGEWCGREGGYEDSYPIIKTSLCMCYFEYFEEESRLV